MQDRSQPDRAFRRAPSDLPSISRCNLVLGSIAVGEHRAAVPHPEIAMNQPLPPADADNAQRLTILQVIQSVAWAFFGVQSHRNRVRDFTVGQPLQFVIVGVLLTGVVVALFVAAAQLALHVLQA